MLTADAFRRTQFGRNSSRIVRQLRWLCAEEFRPRERHGGIRDRWAKRFRV